MNDTDSPRALRARGLRKDYGRGEGLVRAVDDAASSDVLRLFEAIRGTGPTIVIVTHDERVASIADRRISMRDGALVGDTRPSRPAPGNLAGFTGMGG